MAAPNGPSKDALEALIEDVLAVARLLDRMVYTRLIGRVQAVRDSMSSSTLPHLFLTEEHVEDIRRRAVDRPLDDKVEITVGEAIAVVCDWRNMRAKLCGDDRPGAALRGPATVHLCCGCSCHVCADGHRGGEHTEPCRERFWREQEEIQGG